MRAPQGAPAQDAAVLEGDAAATGGATTGGATTGGAAMARAQALPAAATLLALAATYYYAYPPTF